MAADVPPSGAKRRCRLENLLLPNSWRGRFFVSRGVNRRSLWTGGAATLYYIEGYRADADPSLSMRPTMTCTIPTRLIALCGAAVLIAGCAADSSTSATATPVDLPTVVGQMSITPYVGAAASAAGVSLPIA